ncbi:hypothetical protein Q2941_33640 [Bradyrhizobium sp. UFLA05-153]
MTSRSLINWFAVSAILAITAAGVQAQDPFPAPLPGQTNGPDGTATSGTGAATAPLSGIKPPSIADECRKEFLPLREEAERRGKLIKSASDRHAPPDEACKLIGDFSQAESGLIKFVDSHATTCGIPTGITDQLKSGHKNTETMLTKVCKVAEQMRERGPAGPTGDFWPEKREPADPTGDFGRWR